MEALTPSQTKSLTVVVEQVAANLKARGINRPDVNQIDEEFLAVLDHTRELLTYLLNNPTEFQKFADAMAPLVYAEAAKKGRS